MDIAICYGRNHNMATVILCSRVVWMLDMNETTVMTLGQKVVLLNTMFREAVETRDLNGIYGDRFLELLNLLYEDVSETKQYGPALECFSSEWTELVDLWQHVLPILNPEQKVRTINIIGCCNNMIGMLSHTRTRAYVDFGNDVCPEGHHGISLPRPFENYYEVIS